MKILKHSLSLLFFMLFAVFCTNTFAEDARGITNPKPVFQRGDHLSTRLADNNAKVHAFIKYYEQHLPEGFTRDTADEIVHFPPRDLIRFTKERELPADIRFYVRIAFIPESIVPPAIAVRQAEVRWIYPK